MRRIAMACCVLGSLSACSTFQKKPEKPIPMDLAPQEGPKIMSLFSDPRASQVGDLITVQIIETSRGSSQTNAKVGKNTVTSLNLDSPLSGQAINSIAGATTQNKFQSNDGIEKSNNLVANVTAVVEQVFPNGNMAIWGEQEITADNGLQTITVTGIVRPDDIAGNNSKCHPHGWRMKKLPIRQRPATPICIITGLWDSFWNLIF